VTGVKDHGQTYRQVQAQETRRRIAGAARRAFAENGYANTSIVTIAREAGVAVRTVYAAFGTKMAILGAACEAWLIEADARGLAERAFAEPDARRRLALVASACRRQWESGREVIAIMQSAAGQDAEVARMLEGWKEQRMAIFRQLTALMEPDLKPGLPTTDANALVRALTSAEVYEGVRSEGWSTDRYEEWLAQLLAELLLP